MFSANSQRKKVISIKHDLVRSCFQFWPKIGEEGDKILREKKTFFLSPTEPILKAKIENMISPDYVLCYIPRANGIFGNILKFLENFKKF